MSFSYSGNPTSSRLDAIRFTIQDTNAQKPIMQNEEIQYIIDTYTTDKKQLAVAYRQCATYLALQPIKRGLGPQTEDNSDRLKYYTTQAELFEKQTINSGVPPTPEYSAPVIFEKGMMANE